MIFMTTSYGCNTKRIGFNDKTYVNNNLKELLGDSFLNKIGKIYNFNELDRDIINKIIISRFKNKISPEIVDKIISMSDYTKFGASKINNIINTMDVDLVEV